MALRALVFDYGRVLTGPPDAAAWAELKRITGLSTERLDRLYWADRPAYDLGELNGMEFWCKVAREAGLKLNEPAIEELNLWDARMWTCGDPTMLAWQLALKQRGLKTAILSNMGQDVLEYMGRELPWLKRFDALVWSYRLHIVKPDPAIYRYTLEKLGAQPAEALFLDDRKDNVDAANALGMKGLIFTNVEQLRTDLVATGLDRELPLP